jgi:hypothetical protein
MRALYPSIRGRLGATTQRLRIRSNLDSAGARRSSEPQGRVAMTTDLLQSSRSFIEGIIARIRLYWPRIPPQDTRSRTWSRRLASYNELPDLYRPFFDALPAERTEPFPYTVLTPTFKDIPRRAEREKLVCLLGDELLILEGIDDGLAQTRFPLNGHCLVERGVILLQAWITIRGKTSDGDLKSATLRFNSVTDHIMAPFVDRLRHSPAVPSALDLDSERARFNYLAQTHYKFYSHGRSSIQPGARVQQILLQPEIRRTSFTLLGYSLSRRLSPAHLVVLTDTELILIRDDESQYWLKGAAHGAIWSYVPRNLIASLALTPGQHDLLTFHATLRDGATLRAPFESSAEPDLRRLIQQLPA